MRSHRGQWEAKVDSERPKWTVRGQSGQWEAKVDSDVQTVTESETETEAAGDNSSRGVRDIDMYNMSSLLFYSHVVYINYLISCVSFCS